MALKFPCKHSPEINLLDFISHLLELVTLVIVIINDVIGGFSRLRGLKMIGSCSVWLKLAVIGDYSQLPNYTLQINLK